MGGWNIYVITHVFLKFKSIPYLIFNFKYVVNEHAIRYKIVGVITQKQWLIITQPRQKF